jgi:hypothetical protein
MVFGALGALEGTSTLVGFGSALSVGAFSIVGRGGAFLSQAASPTAMARM